MTSSPSKTILVLGASWCGIPVSHQLLRALPDDYTLTLINPSTTLYYNVAAVRAVAKDSAPGLGPNNSNIFVPFVPGFEKYGPKFTFLQGRATNVNPETNTVTYLPLSDDQHGSASSSSPEQTIEYAQLIIATGSRAHGDWPFKNSAPLPHLKAALKKTQDQIIAANTIVLAGGGPTSVETIGEIATLHPEKKVILVSASDTLLPTAPAKVGNIAERTLKQLNVEVRKNLRVESYEAGEVLLSNGEKIQADLYVPTYGLIPNTEFMPKELLAVHNSTVKVNANLRTTVENIWALGDVVDCMCKRLMIVPAMVPVVSANVLAVVKGSDEELKTYDEKKLLDAMFVPIGGRFGKGTGHIGGYKIPGLVVWAAKGRTMLMGNPKDFAEGRMMPGFAKV
ncbi:FAD/NAD(P)-binding domain-containing protein [Ascodesmis nigricans]|uniref:FAD/NAD(P)-binding domain-containing protein n=1 Tax=Ascodesmis nigricans TaxID=341454 RepID=A0A4S2N2A6_9PEZI|nr:FAD/NAD(P)-binding domain-containing protein [Ascodesmis nigricans]